MTPRSGSLTQLNKINKFNINKEEANLTNKNKQRFVNNAIS